MFYKFQFSSSLPCELLPVAILKVTALTRCYFMCLCLKCKNGTLAAGVVPVRLAACPSVISGIRLNLGYALKVTARISFWILSADVRSVAIK